MIFLYGARLLDLTTARRVPSENYIRVWVSLTAVQRVSLVYYIVIRNTWHNITLYPNESIFEKRKKNRTHTLTESVYVITQVPWRRRTGTFNSTWSRRILYVVCCAVRAY